VTEHQGDCSGGNETLLGGKRAKLLTCSGGNETEGNSQSTAVYIDTRTIEAKIGKDINTKWETPRTINVVLKHSSDTIQSSKALGTMTELVECNTTPQDSRNNEGSSGALL
jgi:hypothetical protein